MMKKRNPFQEVEMIVTRELTACDFEEFSWECEYFWERVHKQNLEDALDSYCEELFTEPMDMTSINDIFRFDGDSILEAIGYVDDDSEEDEDEEEVEEVEAE